MAEGPVADSSSPAADDCAATPRRRGPNLLWTEQGKQAFAEFPCQLEGDHLIRWAARKYIWSRKWKLELRSPQACPAGWFIVGRCSRCEACSFHGKFTGRFTEEKVYVLAVSTSGECGGPEKVIRQQVRHPDGQPTERTRRRVLEAIEDLKASGFAATPSAVSLRLPPKLLSAKALAGILRWHRKKYGSSTHSFASSVNDFAAFAAAREQAGSILQLRRQLEPFKWVGSLSACWDQLQSLLPETLRSHELFDRCKEECVRRALPPPVQVHTDWFPGLREQILKAWPKSKAVAGLEHAVRAMVRNHNQGYRIAHGVLPAKKPKRRRGARPGVATARRSQSAASGLSTPRRSRSVSRSVAAERPSAENQTAPDAPAARPGTPPFLNGRPINVFLGYVYESAFLGTSRMFALFWKVVEKRVRNIWMDERWWLYFSREYLKVSKIGEETGYSARWWTGLSSGLLPGHGPSQQVAEMLNRELKRRLRTLPTKTPMDLVSSIEKIAEQWSTPLLDGEGVSDERVLSFMSPVGSCSVQSPFAPSHWMLTNEGRTLRRPGGLQQYFASTVCIVEKFNRTKANVSIRDQGAYTCLCMWVGTQRKMRDPEVDKMLLQWRARSLDALQRLWIESGILEETSNAELKFQTKEYRAMWLHKCLVRVEKAGAREAICSCWCFAWQGHCPHIYAAQEVLGYARWTPVLLPIPPLPTQHPSTDVPEDVDDAIAVKKRRR
eukprot:Skav226898  [mRNA]  locus=scaffold2258:185534:188189:- [translate_table: standard]